MIEPERVGVFADDPGHVGLDASGHLDVDLELHLHTSSRKRGEVLDNFLGTYTSRNSDYGGYWLLGQLRVNQREWTVDLLGTPPTENTPEDAGHRLAIRKFAEQVNKAGLTLHVVREARLRLARTPQAVEGQHGDFRANGNMVRCSASASLSTGSTFERECLIFVAPHNPKKERRSSRAGKRGLLQRLFGR